MPAKSAAQERLMQAAAHTPGGYGGVPQSVGKEFVGDMADFPAALVDDISPYETEIEVARAIASGELTSPQIFRNVHLWALRITGTGAAYRSAGDEYAWRDPALYLNDEFLARCNGLPVIFEHPEEGMLTSKEYKDRNVGGIMLPYINGEDVWGIARIYDDETNELLKTERASTSPGVVLKAGESEISHLDGGEKLLKEGMAALIDHLAICEQGVWDKGGAPTGVASEGIEDQMTEEERAEKDRKDAEEAAEKEKADAMKADADRWGKLDKFMDSMSARVGALECAKSDKKDEGETEEEKAEKAKADKAKKDAEEAEAAEKEKADRAKADADMKAKLDEVADKVRDRSDEETEEMADTQAKADSIGQVLGIKITGPMNGESALAYRRRTLTKFKAFSPDWKDADLSIFDSATLAPIERQIYNAAVEASKAAPTVQAGKLQEVITTDDTGRRIRTYHGKPDAWMFQFKAHRQNVKQFNTDRKAG